MVLVLVLVLVPVLSEVPVEEERGFMTVDMALPVDKELELVTVLVGAAPVEGRREEATVEDDGEPID